MNYYNPENKDLVIKMIKTEIEIKKDSLKYFDIIKPIVLKYNGKVYSKRFDNDIKKLSDKLYVSIQYNSFNIKYYDYDKIYVTINKNNNGAYLKKDSVYIVGMCKESVYADGALNKDNTIDSENIINNIDRMKSDVIAEIESIENALKLIDEYENSFKELKKKIDDHNNINYTIAQYFGLRIDCNFHRYD